MPFVAFSNNVVGMDGEYRFDEVGFDDFKGTLGARTPYPEGSRRIASAETSPIVDSPRFDGYCRGMQKVI